MSDDVKILGVYSQRRKTATGVGGTAHVHAQVTYWFARRLNDDDYEVQPLNGNNVPSGVLQILTKGEFISAFTPEPDYYEKKTLPALHSLKAKLDKGESCLEQGQLDAAEKEFCKAVLIDEANVQANMGLGRTYCLKKDAKKLKTVLDRLLNMDAVFKEEQRFRFNEFGISLRKQKYFPEAIRYYEKALTLDADDENLLFNLARARYETGDLAGCARDLLAALALAPDFAQARAFLDHCRAKADDDPALAIVLDASGPGAAP